MHFMLADISTSGIVEKLRELDVPTKEQYVDELVKMSQPPLDMGTILVFIIMFGCGLVYLLQGWKIFKILVVVNAAILGSLAGSRLGAEMAGPNAPLFCGIAGGLLLAVLALPAMKYAISIMGALVGSFLGYALWGYVAGAAGRPQLQEYAWAGALIGLIALGLLAFVVFRLVVMVFTSVQGSLMVVTGMLGLLMMAESLRKNLADSLKTKIHLLPLLIGVPAIIGFAFQISGVSAKARKKKKAAGGS